MSVVTDLQQFGLSEKEAKIYVTLLDLEKEVVSDISKKSGINRSTTYILLEALRERGFVSMSQKNNVQYWSALPPKNIISIAEEKLSKVKSLVDISKKIVKELEAKYKGVGERPCMNLYESKEGIIEACDLFKEYSKGIVYGKKSDIQKYTNNFDSFLFNNPKSKDILVIESEENKLIINQREKFAYILRNVDL